MQTSQSQTQTWDIIHGADAIAEIMFGEANKNNVRRVYYLARTKAIPAFKMGTSICARRDTLAQAMGAKKNPVTLRGAREIAEYIFGSADATACRRVYHLIDKGLIPTRRIGGAILADKAAIDGWLANATNA
ncbi:MAG: hypothetical protein H7Y60_12445 [Rhodospirillaceae bacterium]|nr:hypothetical protein [Rhodospirillales bacterium]